MKIAVVGGGVAGLTAAWLLASRHHVTLLESNERLGGNAWTLDTDCGPLDIAVAAFGKAGYPNFYALLDALHVDTALCLDSYMSLHDRDGGGGLYITPFSGSLRERAAMLHPRHLRGAAQLWWGLRRGLRLLQTGELDGLTLEAALTRIGGFRGDARHIFLATLCLVSSMSADEVLQAPASYFFDKLRVHHDIISPRAIFSVRCARHRTRAYIQALADGIVARGSELHTQHPVHEVRREMRGEADGIWVDDVSYDAVVLACNADQALALLRQPSDQEQRVLGAWSYKEGRVVVHRDLRVFPPRRRMQAYTFLYTDRDNHFNTSVNGALWYQPGARDCNYISSQHPNFPIDPQQIALDTMLRTPIFDQPALSVIDELPSLNGQQRTWFCGSHFGHGLHDDAVRSAMAVAAELGAPFQPVTTLSRGRRLLRRLRAPRRH